MQFSSLLALSASLLASQASAQYFDPMMVNSIVNSAANPGLSPNAAPNANPNPNPKPHHYHDPMDVYNAPAVTPSMSMSMAPSMAMSTPMSMSRSHSMRPMHSSSMGPMYSHGAMTSMVTMASSSSMPHSMAPMATPPSPFNYKHIGLQAPAPAPAPAPAAENGGIAPIDPMSPGSNVAPVMMGKPSGKDEGNSFCMGLCYPSEAEAKCAKPYASPLFKKDKNCWMCCFTPGDF